jgi:hypothetical protein
MANRNIHGPGAVAPSLEQDQYPQPEGIQNPGCDAVDTRLPGGTFVPLPGASAADIADDLVCLLNAGRGVFEDNYDNLTQTQWAGIYLLRAAAVLALELTSRRLIDGEVSR